MYKSLHWLFLLIVVFVSCNDDQVDANRNIKVLGHGGSGFPAIQNPYPPNSKAAISQALLLQGADGVEFDIQLNKSGEVVIYHDERLETATDGRGTIFNNELKDLQSCSLKNANDPAKKFPLYFLKEFLSDYDDLSSKGFTPVISLNIHPQYDVQDQQNYCDSFSVNLLKCVEPYAENYFIIIECPDRNLLKALVRDNKPGSGIHLFYTENSTPDNLDFATSNHLEGMVSNYLKEDQKSSEDAKSRGLIYVLYGLKIRTDISKSFELHPDMVQTDNIPLTVEIRDK